MTPAPDPADTLDAKADGAFQSAGHHRGGYDRDPLAVAEYWARKGATLHAGEGAVLCAEIDRLRWELGLAKIDPKIRQLADTLNDAAEQFFKRQEASDE